MVRLAFRKRSAKPTWRETYQKDQRQTDSYWIQESGNIQVKLSKVEPVMN